MWRIRESCGLGFLWKLGVLQRETKLLLALCDLHFSVRSFGWFSKTNSTIKLTILTMTNTVQNYALFMTCFLGVTLSWASKYYFKILKVNQLCLDASHLSWRRSRQLRIDSWDASRIFVSLASLSYSNDFPRSRVNNETPIEQGERQAMSFTVHPS